ncbi:MAG: glycosyl hydrolase-related protein, partial [Defluviitaleaceae bacterium]|nr:glycosyl hydrolase-related protein [Defluviitaleaceae bacterium]
LMVYNPAPFARTEVMEIILEIPDCWNCKGFDILDENGNKLAVQIRDKSAGTKVMTQSPNDVANFQVAAEYRASVEFTDVPGMGYRCFKVAPVVKPKPENPVSMVTGARRMANEFLEVTINANGTYDILDKNTGKTQKNLGWFKDSSEVGDPWKRVPVANESIFTTLNESAEVSLARDGELETVFKVRIPWRLPAGANGDETARDERFNSYTIENTLTLRKGQPWLDVVTSLSNNCESHYLQVGFPTDIRAEYACAQGQFDVVKRPMKRPDYSLYTEIPMTEAPMNSFVDVSDGETGFGLLNEGLKAYEASPERDGDALYLSLLRCYPLRMCVTEHDLTDYSATDKGSQCPGPHTFRYAVMPHRGDWQTAGLWRAAERFNLAFQAAETAPTEIGREPLAKSFLEFTKDGLHVSAVKRAEDGDGWVVRLFNPFDETFACKMRVNGGLTGPKTFYSPVERLQARGALPESKGEAWAKVREVTLEELPVREMAMDGDGWIDLEVMKKKIVTVKLA